MCRLVSLQLSRCFVICLYLSVSSYFFSSCFVYFFSKCILQSSGWFVIRFLFYLRKRKDILTNSRENFVKVKLSRIKFLNDGLDEYILFRHLHPYLNNEAKLSVLIQDCILTEKVLLSYNWGQFFYFTSLAFNFPSENSYRKVFFKGGDSLQLMWSVLGNSV